MIKKLEFIEQYIDEKPVENYWRGINAICDGITVFDIHYRDTYKRFGGKSYFIIRPVFFPHNVMSENKIVIFEELKKEYYSKEEAKEAAQTLFEKYINLFLNKQ